MLKGLFSYSESFATLFLLFFLPAGQLLQLAHLLLQGLYDLRIFGLLGMRLVAHHIVLLGNFKREITPLLHLYCGNARILDLYRNLNGRWLVGDGVIMGMLGLLYGYRWRGRSRCMVIIKMIFDV